MMSAFFNAPPLLAQAAAQDTVVMQVARDGFATVSGIAEIAISIVVLMLLAVITVVLFQLRKVAGQFLSTVKRMEKDPLVERSRRVAENVDFITLAVRSDMQKVNHTVTQLSERLNEASDLMEERIADFNALMEVVQGEAEGVFVDTASTVRGVTAGARSLQGPRKQASVPSSSESEPVRDGVLIEIDEE